MNMIFTEQLQKNFNTELNVFYIFLGTNLVLINQNQDRIIKYANKKGFLEKNTINIEKHQDWIIILHAEKKNTLFSQKKILIINILLKEIDKFFIKKLNYLFLRKNTHILFILKFHTLSKLIIKNKKIFNYFLSYTNIVNCFTPYNTFFLKWIKYEVQKKNINMETKSLLYLYKNYQGNTLFIQNILEILSIIWPKTTITKDKIKKIKTTYTLFSVSNWVDSIFQKKIKKAIQILDFFFQKQYNCLILIRALQKDLLLLINIKRQNKINTDTFLKKNNICIKRQKFFKYALNNFNFDKFFEALQILVQIEIKIKKNYNTSVWIHMNKLTLLLCEQVIPLNAR